ncbi:glycosyl transferase family 2 [Desulfarculus baarsii DSM 2075]|uniref:Glycosyl transferase family 2 n=2 Tax=Pseudomonadati TaxID=3379134 RepID=E1QFM4_DESB2|nr:glycosyltransferase family A protein [Desulfarculus baarsii]ADK84360.1 glycosyl transferase family 2 [Desulfarculus baarsii DSM 2075]
MNAQAQFEISAIMTVHGEGVLAGLSLRSMLEAVDNVRHDAEAVELMVVLDCPDNATRSFVESLSVDGMVVLNTDFADQGKVRNHAIKNARGRYVAFLDGDDLWSFNWLSAAWDMIRACDDGAIVHPEFNWLFDMSGGVLEKIEMSNRFFDKEYLRVMNYWDALCFASKATYETFPYPERNISSGFAYEDWYWNCVTVASGYEHVVAPDTVHFKRRRSGSQTVEASSRRALPRMNGFFDYKFFSQGEF